MTVHDALVCLAGYTVFGIVWWAYDARKLAAMFPIDHGNILTPQPVTAGEVETVAEAAVAAAMAVGVARRPLDTLEALSPLSGISVIMVCAAVALPITNSVFRSAARRTNLTMRNTAVGVRVGEGKTCWAKPPPGSEGYEYCMSGARPQRTVGA